MNEPDMDTAYSMIYWSACSIPNSVVFRILCDRIWTRIEPVAEGTASDAKLVTTERYTTQDKR